MTDSSLLSPLSSLRGRRALVPGSMAARIVEQLGKCPATISGLAQVLGIAPAPVSSALVRLQIRGEVRVYYTTREAAARGIRILNRTAGLLTHRDAQVYGLEQAARMRVSQQRGIARLARPGNAGLTAAIRELVAEEPGLTASQIAERLERDVKTVRAILNQCCVRTGGLVARNVPGQRERIYFLFGRSTVRPRSRAEGESEFHVAAPVRCGRGLAGWGQWR